MSIFANNILVTGGAGYIGSHIVELLIKNKSKVFIFDNLITGYKKLINKKVSEVVIILDSDANKTMMSVCERLMKHNINVSRVVLDEGDPSDIGYKKMLDLMSCKQNVNEYDLIRQRLI